MKIHHIALKVKNIEKIEKFYSQILGLEILQRHYNDANLLRSVWLDLEGTILMLEIYDTLKLPEQSVHKNIAPNNINSGWPLLALQISQGERKVWKKRLIQEGVEIFHETQYSLYFKDPEGNHLALSHYPN